ncbi:MAG: hypothetical protein ACYCYK_05510 [Candidatus Dormibacteria bacterium]
MLLKFEGVAALADVLHFGWIPYRVTWRPLVGAVQRVSDLQVLARADPV